VGQGGRGATTPWCGHAWYLRAPPAGGYWPRAGRLPPGPTRATLAPAVEP
jgi:hypothetical protein